MQPVKIDTRWFSREQFADESALACFDRGNGGWLGRRADRTELANGTTTEFDSRAAVVAALAAVGEGPEAPARPATPPDPWAALVRDAGWKQAALRWNQEAAVATAVRLAALTQGVAWTRAVVDAALADGPPPAPWPLPAQEPVVPAETDLPPDAAGRPFRVLVVPATDVSCTTLTTATGLADLQGLVGGDIEALDWPPGGCAYLNENGKALGLPANAEATWYAHRHRLIAEFDFIAGPLVLVGPTDADGFDTDVPDAVVARWLGSPPAAPTETTTEG